MTSDKGYKTDKDETVHTISGLNRQNTILEAILLKINPSTITVLNGGTTNKIYKVCVNNSFYILRIYGDVKSDDVTMFDREKEIKNSKLLSEMGVGPRIHSFFEGGRLEEFYEGGDLFRYDPYKEESLSFYLRIAEKLRMLHLQTKFTVTNKDELVVPSMVERFRRIIEIKKLSDTLLENYPDIDNLVSAQIDKFKNLNITLNDVSGCHNDFHHGNMICNRTAETDSPDIRFIDFEYFGPNIVWYDVCNYFNEMCTLSCNWSRYPDLTMRKKFYDAYLNKQTTKEELNQIENYVTVLTPLNHLMWGLWSLAKYDSTIIIDFDYMSYFKMRIDRAYYLLH